MAKQDFSLKARQDIRRINKTMFVTVALCSALIGLFIVSSTFLIKRAKFNQSVIGEQSITVNNLITNLNSFKKLNEDIKILGTNKALLSNRLNDTETALQVILDALPDRANSVAFGQSLKERILNVPNINVSNLYVSKTDDETSNDFADSARASYQIEYSDIKEPAIHFRVKLTGTVMGLNQVLRNMENSIRPIIIDEIKFQTDNSAGRSSKKPVSEANQVHTMQIAARSFYSYRVEPQMTTKIMEEK